MTPNFPLERTANRWRREALRAIVAPSNQAGSDLLTSERWAQRAWFRELFERANAEHQLHFVDASDALCKSQLKERSRDLPPGTVWTTDAEFDAITVYFQPPSGDERFNVIRDERA